MTIEDPAEKGFLTDQDDLAEAGEADEHSPAGLPTEADSAAVVAAVEAPTEPDLAVLDMRPAPGKPRDYHFPSFERHRLANGLTFVSAHVPGRALLAGQLVFPGGAWAEPADRAGITVLTARSLPEGTQRLGAIDFIEASERLGAEIHADATWEALSASMEVPRSRLDAALALLAEMCFEPAFPGAEVERLRDERLNDLLQAWSDPRRRSERVFPETIYAPETPYGRPLAGIQSTVRTLDRDTVTERHGAMLDPSSATLVVAGDLTGVALLDAVERHLGARHGTAPRAAAWQPPADVAAHPQGARIVLVDRPSAPQSELRIGHIGVARKSADFHAVAVLNAILGGTFNSRLNRVIREERGYSYGINSSFDMRRLAGPFVVRTAVETAVTVPALLESLRIIREFGQEEVRVEELRVAREYLVGVFPLRFETAAQVAAALAGLVVFELPDDELDRYRPQIAAVTAADVLAASRRNIRPADLSIVIVGDAKQVEEPLRAAQLGEVVIVPADASPA